jgi:hypothetical protein
MQQSHLSHTDRYGLVTFGKESAHRLFANENGVDALRRLTAAVEKARAEKVLHHFMQGAFVCTCILDWAKPDRSKLS